MQQQLYYYFCPPLHHMLTITESVIIFVGGCILHEMNKLPSKAMGGI